MAKAVLVTKIGSIYDDLPEERYHFPRQYLGRMESCVGDWIIYYEPGRLTVESGRRAGRRAYFATARVDHIEADPARPDHFYAFVQGYLEFDRAVPFKEGPHYYESKLSNLDGTTNAGTAQNAVRRLPDHEYDFILQAGFAPVLTAEPDSAGHNAGPGLSEKPLIFDRPIVERLVARPFRDAAFAVLSRQPIKTPVESLASRSSMVEVVRRSKLRTSDQSPIVARTLCEMGSRCAARCIGCSIEA
jgi:putative restriction endonuclease